MSDKEIYDRKIFADNLAHFMREYNERQVDIARLLNVSKSTVSQYVKGMQIPRMDKVEILARHYNIRISRLLESEQKEKTNPDRELLFALYGDPNVPLDEQDIAVIRSYAEYVRSSKTKK